MLVQYVGKKKTHIDTLFGTGVQWLGNGDLQPVEDDKVGAKMCKLHPDVYREIHPTTEGPRHLAPNVRDEGAFLETLTVVEASGETVRLIDASRRALVGYAETALGLAVLEAHTRDQILGFIANQEEVNDRMRRIAAGQKDTAGKVGGLAAGSDDPPVGLAPVADPPPTAAPPTPSAEGAADPGVTAEPPAMGPAPGNASSGIAPPPVLDDSQTGEGLQYLEVDEAAAELETAAQPSAEEKAQREISPLAGIAPADAF